MRPLRILATLLILAGAALLIYSVAIGEMQVALVLIVPVIFGGSILGILAIGLIIAGVLFVIADPFLSAGTEWPQGRVPDSGDQPETTKRKEFGGVVLIGPIPIAFGSSKRMAIFAAVIAVIVLVIMLLSLLLSRG